MDTDVISVRDWTQAMEVSEGAASGAPTICLTGARAHVTVWGFTLGG